MKLQCNDIAEVYTNNNNNIHEVQICEEKLYIFGYHECNTWAIARRQVKSSQGKNQIGTFYGGMMSFHHIRPSVQCL
jgi:hypothetical protein